MPTRRRHDDNSMKMRAPPTPSLHMHTSARTHAEPPFASVCALASMLHAPYKPRLIPGQVPLQDLLRLGAWPAIFQGGPGGENATNRFELQHAPLVASPFQPLFLSYPTPLPPISHFQSRSTAPITIWSPSGLPGPLTQCCVFVSTTCSFPLHP